MSNKTSDKNVGNKIKQQTENTIKYYKNIDNIEEVPIDILRAMYKDILSDYTRQKQINEEHRKLNGKLREKVKELEEEIAMLKKASNIAKEVNIEDVTDVINKSCKEFMSNYIPKQAVIDKIKEYDKKMEEDAGHPNWVVTDRIVMNVLQELLETK